MNFQNLRIGIRLGVGFGLSIVVTVLVIGLALVRFDQVADINTRLIDSEWVKAEAANVINATTRANARRTLELLVVTDPAQRARIREHIAVNRKAIDGAVETLDRLIRLPEGRQLLQTLKTTRGQYVASFSRVSQLVEEGQVDAARQLMLSETMPALDRLQGPIDELTALQKRIATNSGAEVRSSIVTARALLGTLAALCVVLGAGFSVWVTRSITRPIAEAVQLANQVAAGDLDHAIVVHRRDECGQLLSALKAMSESLGRIVGQVRHGADAMATATTQIAAGSLDLSSRTEEQASALQQTAASMQGLAQTVKHNFESSQHANQLAESASKVALKGGEVVGKVVETMEEINSSSRRIADIIGVIDSIAAQTNLLALNASVEAARAGEQGRGFAVVAGEVRNLAGRSATAAKEIKDLIGTSVGSVRQGCQFVEQAGSTMDEIVVHVRRVADLMREITQASEDQTGGIDQIRQAVEQMEQVTQQNAALVEESAAATHSLEDQADALVRAVGTFKLRADQAGAVAV